MKITIYLAFLIIILSLTGCGSGGSSAAVPAKVVALMKSSALSPAAATVGAISCTISFPDGVYAKTDTSGNVIVAETVQVIKSTLPAGTIISVPVYHAATVAQRGSIQFDILNADGFSANEEVAVSLQLKNGYLPKAADFLLESFTAWDLSGKVTTLNPTLSVQ